MNTKSIVGVLVAIVLIVLVVQLIDRRNEPSHNLGNSIEHAGDNIQEGLNDAGRGVEDAVD